jgi:hypothetical protein
MDLSSYSIIDGVVGPKIVTPGADIGGLLRFLKNLSRFFPFSLYFY